MIENMEGKNIMAKIDGSKIDYGIKDIPKAYRSEKFVEKYWGNMQTLFDKEDHTIKRIFMKANSQSSLEYHVKKKETYFIESGKLKVGIRIGRAKNKSFIMSKGDMFDIQPGLMHMRIALEDTVIIEYSTKDDDSDSHIVEDGKKYIHKEEE
jgi:mannose-6-phosphate isomerase